MLIVGLTGGIASGKSTVSSLLQNKHHLPLIDLDLLAREVVRPTDSSRTLSKLVAHFGSGILQEDGTLDRPVLGRQVFRNEEERKVLNAITHRAIRKRMAWTLLWNWVRGVKVTVVDTPLLIEAGLWRWCGELVVVWW
jgi:dephospho-CoA kinase